MGEIYDEKIPPIIVETINTRSDFASKFEKFLNYLGAEFITKEIVANLKFLIDGQIDGKSLAELIEAGMEVKEAAQDPRYLRLRLFYDLKQCLKQGSA